MSGRGDGDGIDAPKAKTRPRPPAPVAPGDRAPGVGRVVAVRRAYDRYLSVEQRDVEVDVAGAKEIVSYDVVSHPRAHCAFVVVFPFHPAGGGGEDGDDAKKAAAGASTSTSGAAAVAAAAAATAAATAAAAAPPTSSSPPSRGGVPTVTLLREYCHGINGWLYTLPTGGLDERKHGGCGGSSSSSGGGGGGGGEGAEEEGRRGLGGIGRAAAAELSEEAGLEGGDWECLLPDTDDEKEEEGRSPSSNPLAAGVPEAKWCANRFWPFLVVGGAAAARPGERDAEEKLGTMEVLDVTVPELKGIIMKGRMLLPSVQASFMALERLRERGLL